MSKFAYNIGYFLRESKTIFKVDKLSNIFSIFSIGLIFFILSMIFSGWWISARIVEVLEKEAEISIYFDEELKEIDVEHLVWSLEDMEGIRKVSLVDERESFNRMADILGKEANILELFEENPFSPFIEIQIEMNKIDDILLRLELLDEIQHIRDNRDVIDKLQNVITILTVLGLLIISAVGISTLVVVSHIIRQGIYNNRNQINTLKLLGAPDSFIGLPFLLEGVFLTFMGGLLASGLSILVIYYGYSQIGRGIPFIPLPDKESLIMGVGILTMGLSFILGIVGSLFGLSSAKD